MASNHNQLMRRTNSLIPKINLNIENFSERNIVHKLDSNEMGYFLNKISDVGEDKGNTTTGELRYNPFKIPSGELINRRRKDNFVNNLYFKDKNRRQNFVISERSINRSEKQSVNNSENKWKGDLSSMFNSERKENPFEDFRKKKTEFIFKQRKNLLNKEYKTSKILPRIMGNKDTQDFQSNTDDLYEIINGQKELELVKKYILPKDSSPNSKNIIKKQMKGTQSFVKLQDLLPKTHEGTIDKGFTIKIVEKGNSFIYQLVREKSLKEVNQVSSNAGRVSNETIENKGDNISGTRNDLTDKENKRIVKVETSRGSSFGNKQVFKKPQAKIRYGEDLNKKMFVEMAKLNEVKNAIHQTFNTAIIDIYKKESMAFLEK